MNNIPENILQQVADAAFENAQLTWGHASTVRRAVIQHALDNPALAPFLAGGTGEYTDAELMRAWNYREYRGGKMSTTRNLRAFLAALPRRESPPLAEAPPPAKPEPAAQVPLGPEDVPPGSVLKALSWKEYEWRSVSHVYSEGVLLDNCPTTHSWIELEANWQINTSLPDTGRWDANAWRPCSKPGKEVAK